MGKQFSAEELVGRTFFITMVGVGLFIAAVFLFIL
jgi:hypothetical protein